MLKTEYIEARDLPDAWFQLIYRLMDVGYKYEIQKGSYEGETRLEFDYITCLIKKPYSEPYDTMLPEIPAAYGIPNPVANGYIDDYLPYIMTDELKDGEQYTYGSRIVPQLDFVINTLANSPNTNQVVIQIAQPSDKELPDPPCLREIDCRVRDGRLIFFPRFRSWDLWGGFSANLAAIAVLQKYVADSAGLECGEMIASSKGLHIYGYVEEMARIRTGKATF